MVNTLNKLSILLLSPEVFSQGKYIEFNDLNSREIPVTNDIDPLQQLTNDAEVANWLNQGLPADRMSKENGAMIMSCSRWPLIIDPQLQGIKWITNMEETRLGLNDEAEEAGNEGEEEIPAPKKAAIKTSLIYPDIRLKVVKKDDWVKPLKKKDVSVINLFRLMKT